MLNGEQHADKTDYMSILEEDHLETHRINITCLVPDVYNLPLAVFASTKPFEILD